MGHTAKVICHNCGYTTKDVAFGSSRARHLIDGWRPAVDFDTNEIVVLNYNEKIKTVRYLFFFKKTVREKGNYVFYCEPGMSKMDNDSFYNFCPKCKEFKVEFKLETLFD